MYKVEIVKNISKKEWNQNLTKSSYSTYYQTYEHIEGNEKSEYFPIFIQIINSTIKIGNTIFGGKLKPIPTKKKTKRRV